MEDDASFVNEPSPEGEALGSHLARLADVEFKRDPSLRPRCDDCAFLKGAEPNRIAGTLVNALKCVIEKEPFFCHSERGVANGKLCAGWKAMINRKGPPGQAPWEFIEAAPDPLAVEDEIERRGAND